MRYRQVLTVWQSPEILNVINTLTLRLIFWKKKTFFKKLEYRFIQKTQHFHIELPTQKPTIRQIEWGVQDGPITKNQVLLVTTFFFQKFCFSLRTPYKMFTWCINLLNVHIQTFWRCWSFIWRFFVLNEKVINFLMAVHGRLRRLAWFIWNWLLSTDFFIIW